MKKLKYGALFLALAVVFSGCSDLGSFFDYNLFTKLGVTTPAVTTTYPAAQDQTVTQQQATLDQLSEDLASAAYLEGLKDSDAIDEVETYLTDLYTNSTSDEVKQEAAVLCADLNLDTSGGTELVANVLTTLMDTSSSGGLSLDDSSDVTDLIDSLLPEEVATAEDFSTLIQSLIDANAAYEALASTLDSTTDTAEGMEDLGINMGDVAQKALVSYVVSNIIGLWQGEGESTADAAENLWAYLQDPTDTDAQPTGDFSSILSSTADGYAGITTLFTVAGLSLDSYI